MFTEFLPTEAVRTLGRDVNDVWREKQLESIPGVGKAINRPAWSTVFNTWLPSIIEKWLSKRG
jgi:hypothetical protein